MSIRLYNSLMSKNNNHNDIARDMISGVVQIHVEGYLEEDIQSVMNPAIKLSGAWSGSGFFVRYNDLEGHIVTNAHVVRNAIKVEISSMLTSEERFEAEVIGLVKKLEPDVALLKLTDDELERFKKLAIKDIEHLELEDKSSPQRGEEIKAIGYPMGMVEPNITGGEITNFISGTEYSTERYITNAAINPGNSGGPCINEEGKVVGLNTAVMAEATNIGYITPASFVKIIISNLVRNNEPHFAGIGGNLQKNAENFNPLLKQAEARGVIVSRVDSGGFLEAASIQKRDVILSVNGIEFDRHGIVISTEGLYRHKNIFDIIKLIPIGEMVKIVYLRNGKQKTTSARARRDPQKGVIQNPVIDDRKYIEAFGMVIQELSWDIIEAMQKIDVDAQIEMLQTIQKNKPTLVVTHIHQGTQADQMEWPVGELIITANGKGIHTLEEFQKVLDKNKNDHVLLECRTGRIGYFFNEVK